MNIHPKRLADDIRLLVARIIENCGCTKPNEETIRLLQHLELILNRVSNIDTL